ncbi:MAG: glycerol-3-phosphate dehydrogenase C-terminal domain-containing protein, partial [Acidimicrobiia bacterium]
PVDRPAATAAEVDYLLETINEVVATDLSRDDVLTTFAGIRPLAGEESGDTSDVSREHRIDHDGDGLVSVRGGKFTTYRLIAADAVDVVASLLDVGRPSVTDAIPLVGASTPAVLEATAERLVGDGLTDLAARWLVGRHGIQAPQVVAAGRAVGLTDPLHPDMPYSSAEAWWAIHREGAFTLDDVLARRTRLAIETADHGMAAAPVVAQLLGEAHGWSGPQTEAALAAYQESSSKEYDVPCPVPHERSERGKGPGEAG